MEQYLCMMTKTSVRGWVVGGPHLEMTVLRDLGGVVGVDRRPVVYA